MLVWVGCYVYIINCCLILYLKVYWINLTLVRATLEKSAFLKNVKQSKRNGDCSLIFEKTCLHEEIQTIL